MATAWEKQNQTYARTSSLAEPARDDVEGLIGFENDSPTDDNLEYVAKMCPSI